MAWVRMCGTGAPTPKTTILTDLTGSYPVGSSIGSTAIKNSATLLPTIVSGQKLRLNISNMSSASVTYTTGVRYSTDGLNWVTLESKSYPVPYGSPALNVDYDLSSLAGNRVYLSVIFTRTSANMTLSFNVNSATVSDFS